MANGAATDYRIFVAASTGYFAFENPAGELHVYPANRPQVIPACQAIALWPCAGALDPTPNGEITALDCHGIALTALDVRGLAALKTLDCSQNQLPDLDLDGLVALENLYCDQNPFITLDLRPCHSLTFVRYAANLFGYTDLVRPSDDLACHDWPLFSLCQNRAANLLDTTKDTLCAAKYISPRIRSLTPEEAQIRDIAYALKKAEPEAVAVAAPTMAALIAGPCWLIPIPASNGSLDANIALARAVATLVPGAHVKLAIARSQPVESSTDRRRRRMNGLQAHEHHFVRTGGPVNPLPVYFVDNVITTGNTIRAARAALGWGTGLAYADASSPFNNRLCQATASRPARRRGPVEPALQPAL
jgi:predicted amidophosphoribosyltransferase